MGSIPCSAAESEIALVFTLAPFIFSFLNHLKCLSDRTEVLGVKSWDLGADPGFSERCSTFGLVVFWFYHLFGYNSNFMCFLHSFKRHILVVF